MNRTKIEWVKNPDGSQGYTWNPITGCLNGCSYCYARKLANGRLKQRYLANTILATGSPYPLYKGNAYQDPFYPRFWPDRVLAMHLQNMNLSPRGYFVCDMADMFGDWVPEDWQHSIFGVIKSFPTDRFYLLTKQPKNLHKFSPFPDNCWVGVSVEGTFYRTAEAIASLEAIEAGIKFISFEPLLQPVSMEGLEGHLGNIHWIIIGAQTKPYNPPKIEWVKEIILAADAVSIPVFLKDNLRSFMYNSGLPRLIYETEEGEYRQEVPDA